MELVDIGKALRAQLYGSRRDLDQHPFLQAHPELVNRLVSKLTFCVRDSAPQYISVDMSGASGDGSFNIAVYTDDLLFHLSYDAAVDHVTTAIHNRTAAKSVEVLSAPNFMRGDVAPEGGLKVAVSYDGLKVWLPGDNEATEGNRAQLDSFFPSLLRDIAKK